MKKKLLAVFFISASLALPNLINAQNEYRYSIDLNKAGNDSLSVELVTPRFQKSTVIFSFPKIIPGTYAISDYGKFVNGLKAFNKAGKPLAVKRLSDNKWRISNATTLTRITYMVDDIFDTEMKHGLYPMAATNIEVGKNFVLNTPGFFGFFDGYNQLPFTVSITKPAELYASTSLVATEQTSTRDVFKTSDVDELYDSPIMYTVPDTTTITVGNCKVLVSVYSPGKNIQSKQVAEWMGDLLEGARQYLGGKLPANKYAFLYYFKDPKLKHNFPVGLGGHWNILLRRFTTCPISMQMLLNPRL
jgi:predicted metalloprotease with PDZ domain